MLGPSPLSHIRGAGPGRRASRERRQMSGRRQMAWSWQSCLRLQPHASEDSEKPAGQAPRAETARSCKTQQETQGATWRAFRAGFTKGQRGGGGASCQTTSSAGSPPCVTHRAGAEGRRGAASSGDGLRGGPPKHTTPKGPHSLETPSSPSKRTVSDDRSPREALPSSFADNVHTYSRGC